MKSGNGRSIEELIDGLLYISSAYNYYLLGRCPSSLKNLFFIFTKLWEWWEGGGGGGGARLGSSSGSAALRPRCCMLTNRMADQLKTWNGDCYHVPTVYTVIFGMLLFKSHCHCETQQINNVSAPLLCWTDLVSLSSRCIMRLIAKANPTILGFKQNRNRHLPFTPSIMFCHPVTIYICIWITQIPWESDLWHQALIINFRFHFKETQSYIIPQNLTESSRSLFSVKSRYLA